LNLGTKITVAHRFGLLLKKIELRPADAKTYYGHRISVTKRLQKCFTANRIVPIGSASRGTSIRHFSDIDLMLVLSVKEVRWGDYWKSSNTVLKNIRDQLQDRYTTTEVGRDGQAIVVYFADGQYPVDVVPAVYTNSVAINFTGTEIKSYPVFKIPDGEGGWMDTSPLAHSKYLNLQNLRSRGKLYNVIKLVKFWRSCRLLPIPLNSFHIELLLAKQQICIGAKTYSRCVYEALTELDGRECRALQDPINISGLVKAANTNAKRESAQAAVAFSAQHALSAITAEEDGDIAEALRQWNIVFNGQFPK
jgi:hypothetical protein